MDNSETITFKRGYEWGVLTIDVTVRDGFDFDPAALLTAITTFTAAADESISVFVDDEEQQEGTPDG